MVFDHLPDDIQRAEDATAFSDYTLTRQHAEWRGDVLAGSRRWCTRAATATERLLLEHLGHTSLPDGLMTRVEFVTPSIRRRTWPTLET